MYEGTWVSAKYAQVLKSIKLIQRKKWNYAFYHIGRGHYETS